LGYHSIFEHSITDKKQKTMKNLIKKSLMLSVLAAGLTLASCGSNKTEGDASSTDTISTGTVEPATNDTMSTTTDTVTAPVNDTVAP